MQARYVPTADFEALLDPAAPGWKRAGAEHLRLQGTPLAMQPTAHIRAAWNSRTIGTVEDVAVVAVHDGRRSAFHLEWSASSENRQLLDNDQFPDAAAIVFPSVPAAPILSMGAPGLAVNAWYWRADDERARNVIAEGIGTSRTVDLESVTCRGLWKEGRWRVVLSRALRLDTVEPLAQLEPGGSTGFGVAVWDGSNAERGGIKSFSGPVWQPLEIAAVPVAGR